MRSRSSASLGYSALGVCSDALGVYCALVYSALDGYAAALGGDSTTLGASTNLGGYSTALGGSTCLTAWMTASTGLTMLGELGLCGLARPGPDAVHVMHTHSPVGMACKPMQ